MTEQNQHLETLHDIRNMMERSSKFISLSGLSGIGAGMCALAAAYFTSQQLPAQRGGAYGLFEVEASHEVRGTLLTIGVFTFVTALLVAFLFTYIRSVQTSTPIWGVTARRLLWNTLIPLAVGGIFTYRLVQLGLVGLVAPSCLLFYGLALINGSKYTLSEIRWLGFCELLLGAISLWYTGFGLLFWTIGFGILHIIYGAIMWWKYEKK